MPRTQDFNLKQAREKVIRIPKIFRVARSLTSCEKSYVLTEPEFTRLWRRRRRPGFTRKPARWGNAPTAISGGTCLW